MRNWAKRKRTLQQSVRLEFTQRLLQVAKRIENPRFKLFKSLRDLSNHASSSDFDLIDCPKNLDIKLNKICFSDIYFPEEFANLQKGLNQLLSIHSSYSFFQDQKENINKWFDDIYNSSSTSVKTINVGWLVFNHKKDNSLKLIHSAEIQLMYISSTCIALSISVNPSNEFIERFNSIVRNTPHNQIEISRLSLKYGVVGWGFKNRSSSREAELEQIFLDLNKTIVNLFRKTFDAGLSKLAPLLSVEIINVNLSLKEISGNIMLPKRSGAMRACCNFFTSLGYPYEVSNIYKSNDWWQIYGVHRSEIFYQNSHCYQVLLSTIDYTKSENEVEINDEEMYHYFNYSCEHLLFLFAIEHFYDILKDLIVDLKNDLEPTLSSQTDGRLNLKTLESGISKMASLNGLYFQQTRLWIGINEQWLWENIFRDASKLLRKNYRKSEPENLLNDIKRRIKEKKRFCDRQLNLLRLSYGQIISYRTVAVNLKLQQVTLVLSVVVVFLTIATLLPEETRKYFWNILLNWIKDHFL
jgi:hypothetical protein